MRITPLFFCALLVSVAQVGAAVSPRPEASEKALAYRQAIDAAKRNDAATAQAMASAAANSPSGSREWLIETSVIFMSLIGNVQQEGRSTIFPQIIAATSQRLAQAEQISTTPAQKAQARALVGLLNERFIGNLDAAAAAYRAAAVLDPKHPHAGKAADRLERSEANLRQRLAAKSNK